MNRSEFLKHLVGSFALILTNPFKLFGKKEEVPTLEFQMEKTTVSAKVQVQQDLIEAHGINDAGWAEIAQLIKTEIDKEVLKDLLKQVPG